MNKFKTYAIMENLNDRFGIKIDESDLKLPYFACKVNQCGNSVFIPIPYGALENMCRSLLAHNEGTEVVICGIDTMTL